MLRASVSTGIVLLTAGLVLVLAEPSVEFPLPAGELYAVGVESGAAVFDLPLETTSERYLLVVSNLSDSVGPQPFSVASEKIDAPRLVPLRAARSLDASIRQFRQRCASWHPQPASAAGERSEAGRESSANSGRASPDRAKSSHAPARELRTFWLHTSEGDWSNRAAHRPIVARVAARGEHVRVYVDRDDAVDPRTVEAIVDRFENAVRPTIARHIGLPHDVDGDGTFAVLITSWMNRLENGRASLGGMVRPNDFRRDVEPPFSNQADLLFLNSSLRPGPHLETLLAHEFAHAVTACGKLSAESLLLGTSGEDAWLNEAISHVAENLQSDNWSNLDHRVASFLSAPHAAPLVVPNYYTAGLSNVPGPRGGTYLFLRWCVDRYGSGLLRRLVHEPRQGIRNLEAVTGERFDDLYRQYAADLFLQTANIGGPWTPCAEPIARADLGQPLGDWGLAGPRFDVWDAADDANETPLLLPVCGTSTRHVLVHSVRKGPRRITVRAAPGAVMQISLVRLPDEMAQLRLRLQPSADGRPRLELAETAGTGVTLSHLAWEPQGQTHRSTGHVLVRPEALSQLFETHWVPAGGRLISHPLPVDPASASQLTVSAVGIDEHGHRVVAWTTGSSDGAMPRLADQRPAMHASPARQLGN
jgi:hypothetical protein